MELKRELKELKIIQRKTDNPTEKSEQKTQMGTSQRDKTGNKHGKCKLKLRAILLCNQSHW